MARRVREEAMSKRAALRRRSLQDYEIPPTEGEHESVETASLLLTGAPGAAEKAAAKFGPKGFSLAKKGVESTAKYVMRTLKPVLGKSVKAVK